MIGRLYAAFLLAGLLWPAPAAAQETCGKRPAMVAALETTYGEHRVGVAITYGEWLLEIFATPDGETWTMLITDPMGKTCVKGSGTGWQLDRPTPKGTRS